MSLFPWNLSQIVSYLKRPATLDAPTLDALTRQPVMLLEESGSEGRFHMICPPSLPLPLDIEFLTCDFTDSRTPDIVPQLRALADDIPKCTNLVQLDLKFPVGTFGDRDGAQSPLQIAAQKAFHAVMYAACATSPEVVVVDPNGISSYLPEDLSRYQLQPGYRRGGTGLFGDPEEYVALPEPKQDGTALAHSLVTDVRLRRDQDANFTLVVAIGWYCVCLDRGLPAVELNRILPHITIPSMDELELDVCHIDPHVLGAFLSRHRGIKIIRYHPRSRLQDKLDNVNLNIVFPGTPSQATLPHLRRIESVQPKALVALMKAVSPIEPPTLAFTFSYGRIADIIDMSALDLWRRLAEREKPVKLVIRLDLLDSKPPPPTPQDITAAKLLNCVETVEIRSPWVQSAVEFLEWVKVLPRLKRLDVHAREVEKDKWLKYIEEARNTLGPTVRVDFATEDVRQEVPPESQTDSDDSDESESEVDLA